jgi:hypothetical protein
VVSEELFVSKDGSYMHNCYVEKANDRFIQVGWPLCLNGYAVIPLELYQELSGRDVQGMIDSANEVDGVLVARHNEIIESLKE